MSWFKLAPQTLKSRSFWLGIMTIASSTLVPALAVPKIATLAIGAGIIFLRDAISKNAAPASNDASGRPGI